MNLSTHYCPMLHFHFYIIILKIKLQYIFLCYPKLKFFLTFTQHISGLIEFVFGSKTARGNHDLLVENECPVARLCVRLKRYRWCFN